MDLMIGECVPVEPILPFLTKVGELLCDCGAIEPCTGELGRVVGGSGYVDIRRGEDGRSVRITRALFGGVIFCVVVGGFCKGGGGG